MPPTIAATIDENLTCPVCSGRRFHEFPNRWRQPMCLCCGSSFDASHIPTADVFADLLGQANALPEVELGAVRDLVFNRRGW